MKVVILAGGLGSRISEFTDKIPKPMINIGQFPIIWHIMKIYSYYGFNEFIICLGYKSHLIKDFFVNYKDKVNSLVVDIKTDQKIYTEKNENWKIHLVETGEKTMTGGRIKRIQHLINEDSFCMTYGDGLANVNIKKLIKFHHKNKAIATLTAVNPPLRFGMLELDKKSSVSRFSEKPKTSLQYINGGFFVLSKEIFKYLGNDKTIFEKKPLEKLVKNKKLMAFKHKGFWMCMDNLRDWELLNKSWEHKKAPWKIWK
jgi:glucose-1-phosphate cytidylyltransferase